MPTSSTSNPQTLNDMKPHFILTAILYALLTTVIFAEKPAGRYITKKSVWVSGRTINNVVVTLEGDGMKFVVPPGSIDPSLLVEIYREEGTLTVKSGKPADKISRLVANTKKFDGPVEVHIPIANPDKVPVAYSVDKSDAWEPLKFKGLSPDKSTAIYVTDKPVTVAWVTPE